jgi:hypothetical protein
MCAGVTAKSIRFPFLRFILFFEVYRLCVGIKTRDRRFILNMDQTPVFFCMTRKKTLEVISVRTVHIRTLTNDTKRATVAVTIAADESKYFGGGGDENITINLRLWWRRLWWQRQQRCQKRWRWRRRRRRRGSRGNDSDERRRRQ